MRGKEAAMDLHDILHMLWHALGHCLKEVGLILPLLYLTYLLMEVIEHRAGDRLTAVIRRSGRIGPLLGGVVGILPQCGFSAAAAGLYAGRVITLGTLVAVFLSTSDEMVAVLLAGGIKFPAVLCILLLKAVLAVACGFLCDLLIRPQREEVKVEEFCEQENCHCEGKGVFLAALFHALKVALFIFLVSFGLHIAIKLLGEERIGALAFNLPVVGHLLSTLIGLIPNCAASVVLTELYLGGAMSLGAMLSGLLAGAGVGVLVLFRANRHLKENILILLGLYGVSVVLGLLIDLSGIAAILPL